MKLREFVANSLPRVRGRKKKTQSQKASAAKERNDGSQSKCQTSHQQCISVLYQEASSRTQIYKPLSDIGTRNQYATSELRDDATAAPPTYDSCNEYQSSYLNTSLDETKYISPKDIGGFLTEQEKNSLLIYSSDCERAGNSARKSRSRIRTNPWLPSPSSTPYNASRAFHCVPLTTSATDDRSTERCYSDKDVFMETDVSPTTPGSTDSGFKSSVSSEIHVKPNTSCVDRIPVSHEQKPTPKRDKLHHSKKKSSKVLKSSESFDVSRNYGSLQEAKLCIRSQTTVDIDCVSYCHDNGNLDKLKWQNRQDLSLVSPPMNSANSVNWERETSLTPNFETHQDMIQIAEHNISFEYEENLNSQLEERAPHFDPSLDYLGQDETKEVAVQTDFEDNEDSDWMTASSFDDTNQSPRKLSLISDCMQESTDTGYSSLTRDGLLELDEDFQYFSGNKENISNTLNGWLDNKEHLKTPNSMGQSWCEGSWGKSISDQEVSINHMCHSWYEGVNKDPLDIPFDMTMSMYIPAGEANILEDSIRVIPQSSTTTESEVEYNTSTSVNTTTYAPVLEYGPVIRKPTLDKQPSLGQTKDEETNNRHMHPGILSNADISSLSPSKDSQKTLAVKTLAEIENTAPLETSTPVEEKRTDLLRHRTRSNIMDCVKSTLNSRSTSRPRIKKHDICKPKDNLDVIRDYLGYASFEDFYFAKKCPPLSTGRTLNQIKTSLEEKVDHLRQEKFLVEQKICEAQEEERIKKHEKLKFQKQMHYHRKQLLLQTLHDLKEKLENQSDRLQKSYSTILNLQSRFIHRQPSVTLFRAGPM